MDIVGEIIIAMAIVIAIINTLRFENKAAKGARKKTIIILGLIIIIVLGITTAIIKLKDLHAYVWIVLITALIITWVLSCFFEERFHPLRPYPWSRPGGRY